MLDIKKVYIDTRFKTEDSISDCDFVIELPRSLNIQENTICYITDVVIPVSWNTVDSRNNKFYVYADLGDNVHRYRILELPVQNYTGPEFAAAFSTAINAAFLHMLAFTVLYNNSESTLTVNYVRPMYTVSVVFVSDRDLMAGTYWSSAIPKESLKSMNSIMRMGKNSYMLQPEFPYIAVLDLHTIRNVYMTSSSLCNYNIVSNFSNDVIIKKIPVKSSYGQMLYDSSESGYDYLDVSKRSLSRIDFKLLDSFGNVLDLRGNYWSFSLVFQVK